MLKLSLLIIIFLEQQACVLPAKAIVIAHGKLYVSFLCVVKSIIEFVVDVGILVAFLMIDSRRYHTILHRQD